MPHLYSKTIKYLFTILCIHQLTHQEIFAQISNQKKQQELEFKLLDSSDMQPIPYMQFLIKEFNPSGDSLQKTGITNDIGISRITVTYNTKIYFESKFYSKHSIITNDLKTNVVNNIMLSPIKTELEEIKVKDRPIFSLNKIEYRIKKINKSLAPILQNFLKTLNGVTLNSNNSKYLGKNIVFYLDGIKVESDFIMKSALESFEKLEIISAPDGDYWMKASEVIFNIISKKTKNPTLGVQTNTEYAILYPYLSQNLSMYSLGKKVSFRASSIYYTYSQIKQNSTSQNFNQIQSISEQQSQITTTPNFNTVIFNSKFDSLTTLSYHFSYQNINNSQNDNFTYSSLTVEDSLLSKSAGNRIYSKSKLGHLLFLSRQNHKLFIRYENGRTRVKNQYLELNELNQSTFDNTYSTYLNYANRLQLSNHAKLNTTLSWENNNSNTQYYLQNDTPILSYFKSNFIGLRSIIATSFKNISILIGGRIDLINQDFESNSTKYQLVNQLRFLPTFSLQYESEKLGNYNFSYTNDYILPDISQLATFSRQIDPFKSVSGNNLLDAEKSIDINLTHSIVLNQFDLSTDLEYSETNNQLGYSPYRLENNQLIHNYSNVGSSKKISFLFNSSFPLNKVLKTQLSFGQKLVQFNLNPNWNYSNFNSNWLPIISISNSWEFQISSKFSTSINMYFDNYEYAFYDTKRYSIPNTSISFNGTFGREWYVTLNWNTLFSNANLEKTSTSQINYKSIENSANNFRYVSVSILKSFGKKHDNVPRSNTSDEIKRKFKTM